MRTAGAPSVVPAVLLAGLALLAAAPAAAQDDDAGAHVPRSGFWLGGGIGGGVDDEGNGGGGAYLRMGGTLGPRLLLGGDAVGFSRDVESPGSDDAEMNRTNVTASLLFYPSERGGLFVKGGLGFAYAEFSEDLGDATVTFEDTGLGLTLGAGYDAQLGDGNLFLTPNLDVLLQGIDGGDVLDESFFLLTLGIGFR